MAHRLDTCGVECIELVHIFKYTVELARILFDLMWVQFQPAQVRYIFDDVPRYLTTFPPVLCLFPVALCL